MKTKETLDEAASKLFGSLKTGIGAEGRAIWMNGAKWQQEKMYSEEDMMFAYEQGARLALISQSDLARVKGEFPTPREWFDDLKTK